MPAGQGRLTGQETAMPRLALARAAGGVPAAPPRYQLALRQDLKGEGR
jgi:hypothetical protein